MSVVNLDLVKKVFEERTPIQVYHDLKNPTPTTYELSPTNKCIVRNGRVIAIFDESLNILFTRADTLVSKDKNLLKVSEKTINTPFGEFQLEKIEGTEWSVKAFFKPHHYKELIRRTESPLISAYLIGRPLTSVYYYPYDPASAVFNIPNNLYANPEPLLKTAMIKKITGYDPAPKDFKKLREFSPREISKTFEPYVKIPFSTPVPIVYARGNKEFYAQEYNYVILTKNKRGNIVNVEASFCGEYHDFCEQVKLHYEQILSSINHTTTTTLKNPARCKT